MSVARAVWSRIELRDHRLMHRVHRWRAPRWVRLFMTVATKLGDGWAWYAAGVAVMIWGGRTRFAAVGTAGLSALSGIVIFLILKQVSRRKRPCELEAHCWSSILPPDEFSFPSGHTITAFAVTVSLGAFYPYLLFGLALLAVSIAASRIILGMHFLSDVVAGSVIGTLLSLSFLHLLS